MHIPRIVPGFLAAVGLCAGVPPHARAADGDVAAAVRTSAAAIRVDGELADPAWSTAEVVTAFLQREPSEGAAPTFRTEARVAYDDEALYVAVRAFDPDPDRILGFLTRRDVGSASDWIRVIIDSYHDRRTAYEFAVNPAGVKQDSYRFNDGNEDDSWDAVWDVVVARDAQGWQAEFRIPYSQLRFSSGGDGRLGFAIVRHVARLNETSTWPLLPRSASGYVSSFGELSGVERPGSVKRLELAPYALAQLATEPRQPGNPLQKAHDPGGVFGLDLKYAVTQSLSFTGSVNPDFGQVEADPAVVNLGAFETFFPEKRPFFIEGSGTYEFECGDCMLFYSRRIGRAPRGQPAMESGGYSAQPHQTTILGAGKLTGRVGRFSVGVLTAVTQEETAQVALGAARRSEVVEPQAFYSVSRARREFADQSSVGVILTTASRGRAPTLDSLPDSSVTGGTDYDWRLGRRWSLNGFWAGSRVAGSPSAITLLQRSNVHSFQRPDADHVEFDPLADTLNGHAGAASFSKIAGERVRGNVTVSYKSPGFEVNDLGFQRRADEIPQRSWVQIRFPKPGKYVRNINMNFNQWSNHNFAGDRLELGGNFNSHFTFQNLWSMGFGVNLNARTFDDRKTRGGPGAYNNPASSSWQYFNTSDRRPISFHWESFFGADWQGRLFGSDWKGRTIQLSPRVQFRPTSALSGEIGLNRVRSINDAQWVGSVTEAGRTHYLVGRLNQTETSITARLSYTLTPNLSLQLYGQPFSSTGRYENYRELVNGRAARHDDRYAAYAYAGNADFTVLSFRTTNVLRWEFKPGSALFVVWQQGRESFLPRSDYRFARDYGDIFATPSSNTLLVKLSYWLNP